MTRALAICAVLATMLQFNAQLNIININFNEHNITSSSLSQITINSVLENGIVRIEGTLTNSANEILLKTISEPIEIKNGINVLGAHSYKFAQFNFSSSPQANYVQNMKRLPSGAFNYCLNIVPISGVETSDQFCQSVDASIDEQMFLVNPFDGEELNSSTPILSWSHTEPFNLLAPGEHFRIKVAEIQENQSAAEAVLINTPVYINNYVEKHHVQYPLDANKLEKGKKYAWVVEKISNSNIISTTEVWEFIVLDEIIKTNKVYVGLKTVLDGSVYKAVDDKIFFKFDERYEGKILSAKIISDDQTVIKVNSISEQKHTTSAKSTGYNSYILDIKPYKLKKGFYTLNVLDEKNTHYLLKFYAE